MDLFNQLNPCQAKACELLTAGGNVFLTGVAGSGKSYLIRHFMRELDPDELPILASTGAAAILVGGRTFHSFFGLGILQGGVEATVERAVGNKRLMRRLKKTKGVVIDEVSMLSGSTLRAAETIARQARGSELPWGGMRVIAVGDFSQLPPVTTAGQARDWAFLDPTWERSRMQAVVLKTIVRSRDTEFLDVLNRVRRGVVDSRVTAFLSSRVCAASGPVEGFSGTRLFPRRDTTERFNLEKLASLEGEERAFETVFQGQEKYVEDLKRMAPIPEVLRLKEGALVMIRQNDPAGRWINGSLGEIKGIDENRLWITLKTGRDIELERASFSLLDAEGKEVAGATNFPVNLAYASTIHKAQGMTLDQVMVDLRNLWEPGQAYVALSRVRDPQRLHLSGWSPSSIRTDPQVRDFYRQFHEALQAEQTERAPEPATKSDSVSF